MKEIIAARINEHERMIERLYSETAEALAQAAVICKDCLQNGGKILICGNGGSAADAQHIAAELVGRFQKERVGLAGIALTTDTSIMTAIANDYSFERIFARQVESLGREGDVLIGISTSGNSANVVGAMLQAQEKKMKSIAFVGLNGGKMEPISDVCIKVPAKVTARIQEGHILLAHILCELVEEEYA